MMQPAPQQPAQAPRSSITWLFPAPMPAVQQPTQAPTASQTWLFPPPLSAPQQPIQAPTVSQTGFVSNSLPTIDDDAFMDEIFDFSGFIESDEEDAEGSVISEGEQARYDAMPSFSRM